MDFGFYRPKTSTTIHPDEDFPPDWTTALDSFGEKLDQGRRSDSPDSSRFAVSENTQGLTNVLKSMVLHLEHDPAKPEQLVGIRLERLASPTVESESETILYEASVARFPNGELGFVPKLESHRSVRSLDAGGRAP